MPFDANKYLGKQKKKRSFRDKMRIKWYAHKKQTARKYREWDAKYGKDSPTRIEGERTWQEEKEFFSNINGWKQFFLAMIPFCLIMLLFFVFPHTIKNYKETVLSIFWCILAGIGWLVGIVLTFLVSKMIFVFLYQTSVNITSNFVVDVLEEVDKKRAKQQNNNF